MTGINVQPQIIIRRHNNRKRLFRLGNLTSLLRFQFFIYDLWNMKLNVAESCRGVFFVGQYLQRGPCLISVLHTDCYQALTLLVHTHKQAQRQVSNFLHSQTDRTVLLHLLSFVSWLVSEQLYSPLNGVAQLACLLSARQLKVFTGFAFTSHVLVE